MCLTDKLWTTKGKYLNLYLLSVCSVFSQLCVCWAGCAQCILRFPFSFSLFFCGKGLTASRVYQTSPHLTCLSVMAGSKAERSCRVVRFRFITKSGWKHDDMMTWYFQTDFTAHCLNWQLYLLLPEIVRDVQITIAPSHSEPVQKVHSGDEIFRSPSFTAWLPAAALRWHEPENFSFLLFFAKHNIFLFQLPASFIITVSSCIILEGTKLTLQ